MKLEIEHPDIPSVIEKVGLIGTGMNIYLAVEFEKYGADVTSRQRAAAPVDTGELRDNNLYDVSRTRDVVELVIRNDTPYGKFQEFGTGIAGAAAQPMYMPEGTVWNYGTVNAGHRPQSFFYPPILASRAELLENIKTAMGEVSEDAVI